MTPSAGQSPPTPPDRPAVVRPSARDNFESIVDELFTQPPALPYARVLEDWAVDALNACKRCQTRLDRARPMRYCPHCGLALMSAPPLVQSAEVKTSPEPVEPAFDSDDGPADITDLEALARSCDPISEPATFADAQPIASQEPAEAWSREDILKMMEEWQRILNTVSGTAAGHAPSARSRPPINVTGPDSSRIIAGYANALYRLGAYYESSLSSHNSSEAIRCYLKSARLGNTDALARLAPKCAG